MKMGELPDKIKKWWKGLEYWQKGVAVGFVWSILPGIFYGFVLLGLFEDFFLFLTWTTLVFPGIILSLGILNPYQLWYFNSPISHIYGLHLACSVLFWITLFYLHLKIKTRLKGASHER